MIARVKAVSGANGKPIGYRTAECPGCDQYHVIRTEPNHGGSVWEFNGDLERPTFSPSINVSWRGVPWRDEHDQPIPAPNGRCHFFLRRGEFHFCVDSTHDLAGQSAPAPPIKPIGTP